MSTSTKRRGHVRQRGETFTAYWRARDENGGSVQRSKGGFATADAADRHLTKVLRDLDTGNYVEPARKQRTQTFALFVRDDWLPAVRSSLRPSTLSTYEHWLERHVLPHLGTLRLAEITPDRINRMYGELLVSGRSDALRRSAEGADSRAAARAVKRAKAMDDVDAAGLSAQSVKHVHVVLHRVLRDAVKWDRIARNPADRAEPPAPKRREMQVWSAEQLRTFLTHVRSDRLYGAWLLLSTTGMRRSEVLGMRWSDVDLGDAGSISVRQTLVAVGYRLEFHEPKTERSRRRIGLDPATVAALKAHRARQNEERLAWGPAWTETGLVFTQDDGQPIHPQSLSQFFEKRTKAAKLPPVRLHDIRHSYATAALNAGIPAKVISERLGHSSIAITSDIYQHVLPEIDDQAAAKIAAVILG
jgi:integrase